MQSGLSAGLTALRSPPAVAALAGLVLAAGLFQLMFGWAIAGAGAGAPIWRDPPGGLAGALAVAEAIFRDPWSFPLTAAPRLAAPEPTLATGAGAPAWMVVALKALGLGGVFNPLGLMLAVSWLLQPVAMIALLRAAGVRRWSVLAAGAALALLVPTWLAPQPTAPAASGHAAVILALALALASIRQGLSAARVLMFCALVAAAAGLHTAHAAAVAALFAAAATSEVAQRRPQAFARALGGALRVALAAAVTAFVLNGTLGAQAPKVVSPAYPGLGFLLVAVVGLGLFARAPRRRATDWRRYGPLAAVLVGLAAWGLAHAQVVNASGRFGLQAPYLEAPVYAALALGLVAVESSWRGWTPWLLILAVIVQAVDARGLLVGARSRIPPPAVDLAELRSTALAKRAWVLIPACRPGPDDRAWLDRVSLIGLRGGGVVRKQAGCALPPDLTSPARPSDPRVMVMARGAAPPGRDDCRRIEGLVACGRGLSGLTAAPELRAPHVVDFAGGGPAGLGAGWSAPEPTGVWSAAKQAGLFLLTPLYAPEGLTLEFEVDGYRPIARGSQRIAVSHEAARIVGWEVLPGPGVYRVDVPPGMAQPGQSFALEFHIQDAVPVSHILPGSSDPRELGVFLKRVRVSPLKAPAAARQAEAESGSAG